MNSKVCCCSAKRRDGLTQGECGVWNLSCILQFSVGVSFGVLVFFVFFFGGGGRQTFIPHTSSDYFSAEDRLMKNRLHEMLQPTAQQAAPLRKLRGAIPLAYF